MKMPYLIYRQKWCVLAMYGRFDVFWLCIGTGDELYPPLLFVH
nr:MAG TPA: hypothetical protein [Caudoviricetes sp.]